MTSPDAATPDTASTIDSAVPDAPVADVAQEPVPAPPPDLAPDLPADLPPDGPGTALPTAVAHWRLDSAYGAETPDELGRNPGTLANGAAPITGGAPLMFPNPSCIALDGDNDYVSTGVLGLPWLNQPKSLSVWVWTDEDASGSFRKTIVSVQNRDAQQSIHLGLEYGALAVWRWRSAGASLAARSRATLREWHHIGYTFDGQRHTLYVDGTFVASVTFSLTSVAVAEVLLGTYHTTDEPSEWFQGRVDDLRIYDRALTASQISTLAAGAP